MHGYHDACTIVIFGATGDLTRRLLAPALYRLHHAGLLGDRLRFVLYARRPIEMKAWLQDIADQGWFEPGATASELERFAARFDPSIRGDLNPSDMRQLCEVVSGNAVFYLALPPGLFATAAEALGAVGLNQETQGFRRIVLEKPFGQDLDTALMLHQRVVTAWRETQIYRIDHYLGKETVQNILVFRFANTLLETAWNRNYVDHVQIVASETLGLESRATYYDEVGALRDMVQNHLMQMMALTAMEPPARIASDELRSEKVKVLQCVRPIPPRAVSAYAVRGQYTAGTVEGAPVVGYAEEDGIAANTQTETYAAVKFYIDNWRWQGVPFYLRTGKRLSGNRTEISVQFKAPPIHLFRETAMDQLETNRFIFEIKPHERIKLVAQAKAVGLEMRPRTLELVSEYAPDGDGYGAYESLLLDALQGDRSHFLRFDEVEAAWTLLDPIIRSWRTESVPIYPYAAGTDGPREADRLLDAPSHHWNPLT